MATKAPARNRRGLPPKPKVPQTHGPNISTCLHCALPVERARIPSNSPRPDSVVWIHRGTSNIWCQTALLDAGLAMSFAEPH